VNKAYKAELLRVALYASLQRSPITIKSSPATVDTVTSLIRSNAITGCTIDGTSYDFNCTGGIWDSTEYDFLNNRLESITRD
jgi:hypothetical protein